MAPLPPMKGIITVDWSQDDTPTGSVDPEGPQTPQRDGEAPSFDQHLRAKLGDQADRSIISGHQTIAGEPDLRAHSTADRWKLRIGNSATVVIQQYGSFDLNNERYDVTVQIERADSGTTVIPLPESARTYDDAYTSGTELARELVNLFGIIDHADTMIQSAQHRAELRLREGWIG